MRSPSGVGPLAFSTAQLPGVTPSGTVSINNQGTTPAPAFKNATGSTAVPQSVGYWTGLGGVDPNSDITADFSGTPFGSDQAHPNVQPSRVTNKIIFTGVV